MKFASSHRHPPQGPAPGSTSRDAEPVPLGLHDSSDGTDSGPSPVISAGGDIEVTCSRGFNVETGDYDWMVRAVARKQGRLLWLRFLPQARGFGSVDTMLVCFSEVFVAGRGHDRDGRPQRYVQILSLHTGDVHTTDLAPDPSAGIRSLPLDDTPAPDQTGEFGPLRPL